MKQRGSAPIIQILIIITALVFVIFAAFRNFKYTPSILQTVSPTPLPNLTSSPIPSPLSSAEKTPVPSPTTTSKPQTPTPAPIVTSNNLPIAGYSSFYVKSDTGTFKISVGVADIASTKVVVDTASDSDCSGNCPAYPLDFYIKRRNAFAGINGTYFCPIDYSSCAGQTNSFDFLVMNINKYYFNSAQNVYSTNPVAIFASSYVTFLGQAEQWGRDTGPDGVISNYPMLVQGGNIAYAGSSDPKITVKTTRSFVANKGHLVYIGDIFNASAEDSAHVLHTLGVDNALNLDDAGSAAFWYGGYKVGPGRNIPNAILFIQR